MGGQLQPFGRHKRVLIAAVLILKILPPITKCQAAHEGLVIWPLAFAAVNNNNNSIEPSADIDKSANNNHKMRRAVSKSKWIPTAAAAAATSLGIILTTTITAPPVSFSVAAAATTDITRGESLFKANCAGCHAGGQNFIKEKKTLKKDALSKFQSLDPDQLQEFVQAKMPHRLLPFNSQYSDDDYAATISYVLEQALNDKWEK